MKKKNLFLKVMMLFAVILMIVNANAQQTNSREIYGTISFEGTPIEDVNIQIKGTQKGTKTDSKGTYRLTTTVGDIVIYTHVSFEEIAIVVEDVTSELSFELNEIKNELKEAVVTSRKPVSAVSISDKLHQKIRTGVGDVNPLSLPSRVNYIPGRLILPQYATISEFLQGRFAGGPRNYIFDVDGLVYTEEPPINMADIIELYVLRSGVGTLRWCNSVGIPRGCSVVIVRTLNSPEEIAAKREAEAEKYRNQNYYENDAVAIEDKEAEEDTIELQQKEIFGQITTKGTPMKDVSVRVLGTAKGVVTNANGKYKMEVNIGDEIEYSYVGMHKVFVIIEDITSEVNIDMVSLRNSLDEVLVIAKNSRGEVIKRSKKARKKFSTTRGDIDPDRTGFAVGYIDGTKINFAIYQSITEAIQGKVSGISIDPISGKVYLRGRNSSISQDYPAAWEVDGNFTVEEPIGVNLNEIKEIRLLRGPAATNKYGTLGAGGVIVVKTTMGDYGSDERIRGIRQEFTNQDYYQNDAISYEATDVSASHIIALKEYSNRALAYEFYQEELENSLPKFEHHIDAALTFATYFKDDFRAGEILMSLAKRHHRNPEILKAVAYNLQSLGLKRKAVSVYRQILSLRPTYAQSYRDLANAHKEYSQFQDAWKYYMNYLIRGGSLEGEGIEKTVYNEMEYLYYNRPNQTKIKQKFTPQHKNKIEFRDDVRFVVEWNTSEAEFDLEFVGPDKRAYVFEHTLIGNQDLITEEKQFGFSSKEFIIDDVGNGEWLVNLTYKGNKKSAPTYLKFTTYYNWGKPEQRQETKVYKLQRKNLKYNLLKINEQSLVASN